jgi:hypothetical protein
VIPFPDLGSRIRMFQVLFFQAKIDSLFTRDDALLGELSAGMSLRDIKNWFSVAQRRARLRVLS